MRILLIAAVALFAAPVVAFAQDTPPAGPPAPADTAVVELVLRREAFTYPTFARRNPFVALTSADESGPRFDQMQLTGILFYENDRARSIAVISAGVGAGSQPTGLGAGGGQQQDRGQVQRLHEGERWGNVRIVSIGRDVVTVDVTDFGINERREMRLQSRGQGGS